jgi:hypothetical protein
MSRITDLMGGGGLPDNAAKIISVSEGTFTANGATSVVVADKSITSRSCIVFTLKTVGGTPAGSPYLFAVTPGTGFTVRAVAGDTSIYNYAHF